MYIISVSFSFRNQLADLDTITQKLKTRLTLKKTAEVDTSLSQIQRTKSNELLTGTQSGLSTIQNASSLMTTQSSSVPSRFNNASSSDVATSQESAHSRTLNTSSLEGDNSTAAISASERNGTHLHKLLDSGVFSAKNFSDKSGEDAIDSHRSDKTELKSDNDAMCLQNSSVPMDKKSALVSVNQVSTPSINTIEAGYLTAAALKTQTLVPASEFENSGNSNGFEPGTHRSYMTTESTSTRDPNACSKAMSSRSGGTDSKDSEGKPVSSKASTNESTYSEKIWEESVKQKYQLNEEDEDSDETQVEESDPIHDTGQYGSYHRYREMLDDEDDEDEEDECGEDVVEIIPRSLNNMSSVLALDSPLNADVVNLASAEPSEEFSSPAKSSPMKHEGTSLWYSEDHEDNDSFFQQVFEKNRKVLKESEEITMDSWLASHVEEVAGQERLQVWLQSHDTLDDVIRGETNGGEGEQVEESNSKDVTSGTELLCPDKPEEDMRLELDQDSDIDSGKMILQEKTSANVWCSRNSNNSSDDDTPRDQGSLSENKSHLNEFVEDGDNFYTENLENIEDVEDENEEVEELMPQSNKADQPVSLLSNVEFTDTLVPPTHMNGKKGEIDNTQQSAFTTTTALYPYTLELAETHHTGTQRANRSMLGEGARLKDRHMLSKVELDSLTSSGRHCSNSSQTSVQPGVSECRPRSQSNSASSGNVSARSDTGEKSRLSTIESVLTNGYSDNTDFVQEKINEIDARNCENNTQNNQGSRSHRKHGLHSDKDSTVDSAFSESHTTHPSSSMITVNGVPGSGEHVDQEDCVVDEIGEGGLPNFFMSNEELEASMKALKMATCAANNVDQVS